MATLVTGGTGMLGSATAKRLHEAGDDVVMLDKVHNEHYLKGRRIAFDDRLELELVDLADLDAVTRVIRDRGIERIVHLASAVSSVCNRDALQGTVANCVGTANLFEAALRADVKRIAMTSSSAVYPPGDDFTEHPDPGPVDAEEGGHPFSPLSPVYGAGKAYQEALARHYRQAFGMEIAGMRPLFMASAGRPSRPPLGIVSGEMIDAVARGEAVVVPQGRSVVPWIYYQDVVTQLQTLLEAPAEQLSKGPFFDTGALTVTVADIVDCLCELVPDAQVELGDEKAELNLGNGKVASGDLFVKTFGVPREFDLRAGVAAQIDEARNWGR